LFTGEFHPVRQQIPVPPNRVEIEASLDAIVIDAVLPSFGVRSSGNANEREKQ
jgi:hypothetical protein